MKRFLLGIAVVGFAAAPLACDNPFDNDQLVRLHVSQLDAPAAIAAGNPLSVTLTVQTGGCLSFDHFEVERNASVGTLTVWGRDAAKGRKDIACTDDIRMETHSYTFDPPFQSPSFTVRADSGSLMPIFAVVQVQ
jgi:hypothetical protein